MSSVNKNVLGLVFASMHESTVNQLTTQRTMGSIPFGGRYRLIDFTLSNFVNSGNRGWSYYQIKLQFTS